MRIKGTRCVLHTPIYRWFGLVGLIPRPNPFFLLGWTWLGLVKTMKTAYMRQLLHAMYNVRVIIITFALDQQNRICKVGKRLTWRCWIRAAVPGRREEADSSGEELLTTEELMDTGRRSTMGREVCMLELAACCRSRLVQSYLLEEDLLGGDWYHVVETSTAAAGKRRLLPL